MSCFLSAATPSRFNCCTGVNLLFLGSGIRNCWAWAANPPHNNDKARTEGATTRANGERMSFFKSSLQIPGLGLHAILHTRGRRAVALLVCWMAKPSLRLGRAELRLPAI